MENIKGNRRTISIIYVALFAALSAVGAFIRVPLPYVPITLQVFFCVLAAMLLGTRLAVLSQIVYILIGLSGIPVFTMGGGPAYVLQPTFGYLLGMVLCTFIIGKLNEHLKEPKIIKLFLINIAGVMAMYLVGVPYLYVLKNIYMGSQTSAWKILYSGFLATIPGDILKCYLAALVGTRLKKDNRLIKSRLY
jgi:biotin transport system substrate-specific component